LLFRNWNYKAIIIIRSNLIINYMDLNKFTIKAQETVQKAQQLAQSSGQQAIEVGHLIKGMLQDDHQVVDYLLSKQGVNIDYLKKEIDELIESYSKVTGGNMHISQNLSRLLNDALNEAQKLKDEFVSVEHLVLALSNSNDKAAQLLKDQGVSYNGTLEAAKDLRKGERVTSQSQEETYNALGKYAKNLIELASEGKLDPVIGRDEE